MYEIMLVYMNEITEILIMKNSALINLTTTKISRHADVDQFHKHNILEGESHKNKFMDL
jgi:hypothetical protein